MDMKRAQNETLILYTRDWCGYCELVKRAAQELGLTLEERNIWESPDWSSQLADAQGRLTVPVLRHDTADQISEWISESSVIIQFLMNYHERAADRSASR
ncbi:MAG: glutaredoxin family protein [Proteobacteria bacterium]|nr:glutaredoxin family protein [Pseudomonadota bacterium]